MKRDDALLKKGLKVRTEVLGERHVQASLKPDPYTLPLVELTTKVAWGMVWSRPGLSRKSRSLLSLGALIALGQPHELRVHMRGALRNGLTREELAEAVIHCAMYAGFPRAAEARRSMCEIFAEMDSEQRGPATRIATKKRRHAPARR